MTRTSQHLLTKVLPAVVDYETAETQLSEAHNRDSDPGSWETQGQAAKRRAMELAIAIDGLADRAALELGTPKKDVRSNVQALCAYASGSVRDGCLDRVRAVAVAYRHDNVDDPSLPIKSEDDILSLGLGYGLDGYGVGKFSGVEVLVRETNGPTYKFAGDAPIAIAGWLRYLAANGVPVTAAPERICGLEMPR